MKRTLALLLSSILALSVCMSGCAKSENKEEAKEPAKTEESLFEDSQEDTAEKPEEPQEEQVEQSAPPMAAEEIKTLLKDKKEGEVFTMGRWEQDGVEENGPEAIEWVVLYKEVGRSLVLSTKVLERMEYHHAEEGQDYRFVPCKWPESDIRAWLNGEFYEGAFEDDEKAMIQEAEIDTLYPEDSQMLTATTEDKVFLLSAEEQGKYVAAKGALAYGIPVEKVLATEPYMSDIEGVEGVEKSMSWWLRTSSDSTLCNAAEVPGYDNLYSMIGMEVTAEEGIRPAMWVVYDHDLYDAYVKGEDEVPEDEDLTTMIDNAHKGDTITMGLADMNPWAVDGYEHIEWNVLEETDDAILVIMKYPCEGARFMSEEYGVPEEEINWESSDLRQAVIAEYENYFSPYERAMILPTKLETEGDEQWKRDGGPETEDYLFIASAEEIQKWMPDEKDRGDIEAVWWLRSPNGFAPYFAAVNVDGSIYNDDANAFHEVRALMWLKK